MPLQNQVRFDESFAVPCSKYPFEERGLIRSRAGLRETLKGMPQKIRHTARSLGAKHLTRQKLEGGICSGFIPIKRNGDCPVLALC